MFPSRSNCKDWDFKPVVPRQRCLKSNIIAREIQRKINYLKSLSIFQTNWLLLKQGYLYHAIDPKSKMLVRDATQVFSYFLLDMKAQPDIVN